MYSNTSVLFGNVYMPVCNSSKEIGNRSDCSLIPEALPPLGSNVDRWTGGWNKEQGQRDGDKDRNRDRGTRTGQRGRDSYIQTGIGTES